MQEDTALFNINSTQSLSKGGREERDWNKWEQSVQVISVYLFEKHNDYIHKIVQLPSTAQVEKHPWEVGINVIVIYKLYAYDDFRLYFLKQSS